MSSEDESEDQEKTNEKEDVPSSRQAKKVARLNQIIYENEHKAKINKVSKILKKKDNERTDEEKEVLRQSPEITHRLSKLKERRGALKQRQLEIEDPKEVLERKCKELAYAIRHSNKVVVYTGAGISTAASIPDYRGPNGVWTLLQKGQQPKAQDLCDAKPTLTHMSIKKLQDEGHVSHVVSQNCDGLHMRSGLNRRKLSEVHGNMYIEICYSCKPHQEYIRLFDVTEKTGVRRHQTDRNCHTCKEPLKDTIVHFGEKGGMKCPYRWKEAAKAADRCDIILCLGTSLKILKKYSCLWCMDRKVKNRPKLYIVNLQWTPRDDAATSKINGRCDDVMKMLMKELRYSIPLYSEDKDPLFSLCTPLLEDEIETTTKKILQKPEPKRKSDPQSEDYEQIVIKTEPDKSEENHFIQPVDSQSCNSVHDTSSFSPADYYRYNGMWSIPPLLSYNPLTIPPLMSDFHNVKQHTKFGEVSFQKYIEKGNNCLNGIKKTTESLNMFSAIQSANGIKCEKNMKLNSTMSLQETETKSEIHINSLSSHGENDNCTVVVSKKNSCSKTNTSQVCEKSGSIRTSSGRARKSFCPNCHGISGKCPCTLLDSGRKKKTCSSCHQSQQQCTCSINRNLSVCPFCRKTSDACVCHSDNHTAKCDSCGHCKSKCTCVSHDRPSLCTLCRQTPDKCKCVKSNGVFLCVVCQQHKLMCKCVSNQTSSSQGTIVPSFAKSQTAPPFMPFYDYAKYPMPMNNFLPLYMPQVFQNNQMNALLPRNDMLPENKINALMPNNFVNNGHYANDLLKVDPILQDHSYLNKDQMQSLSPNCDNKTKHSQQGDETSDSDSKPYLKRSYSYVDDIQREDDETLIPKPEEDGSSSNNVQSSSPIIVVDDDEDDSKQGNQEKPKLMRSASVPGWFGKGLNLKKKRR